MVLDIFSYFLAVISMSIIELVPVDKQAFISVTELLHRLLVGDVTEIGLRGCNVLS